MLSYELEHLAKVGSGLAEKRGDQCIEAHNCQRAIQLESNYLGRECLTATWRAEEDNLARWLHPIAA
ncbi:hypothetical protein D3C76_1031320 [compost metagenome]